jgi:hypothetical protein
LGKLQRLGPTLSIEGMESDERRIARYGIKALARLVRPREEIIADDTRTRRTNRRSDECLRRQFHSDRTRVVHEEFPVSARRIEENIIRTAQDPTHKRLCHRSRGKKLA